MSVTISVVATEGVLGGKPRIEGTRIGVHQIGELVRECDWSLATIADEFDLTPNEIDAALDYYDSHPDEMAAIQRERDETVTNLREQSRATE